MKKLIQKIFLWSWVITLPVCILTGFLGYQTAKNFSSFGIRYKLLAHELMPLSEIGQYQWDSLLQRINSAYTKQRYGSGSNIDAIHLFVPESSLAQLNSHLPQSGFNYVPASLLNNKKLNKVKVKIRGDSSYHWGWNKKSIRIKTSKNKLYGGVRSFNLLAGRTPEQFNNHFSYKLATEMGLISPVTKLVRLYLNGEDRGVYTFIEQLEEMTLRKNGLMPADIYRGEMNVKDKYTDHGINSLFQTSSVWDKVSINNHYTDTSMAPLDKLLVLLKTPENPKSQKALSALLDMEAWGKFSAFQTLTHSAHSDEQHNWRIYYDPWRQKITPIVWDPMGWYAAKETFYKTDVFVAQSTSLHKGLYLNGDFLRARNKALHQVLEKGFKVPFLTYVRDTIALMTKEVLTDPFLRPTDPRKVIDLLVRWEQGVENSFSQIENFIRSHDGPMYYEYNKGSLKVSIAGDQILQSLRLNFTSRLLNAPDVTVRYKTSSGIHEVDFPGDIILSGNQIILQSAFLPNSALVTQDAVSKTDPSLGFYEIVFGNISPVNTLIDVRTDFGNGLIDSQHIEHIDLQKITQIHKPMGQKLSDSPLVWSDTIIINDTQIVEQPLLIKPGTTLLMGPRATLILKNRILVQGTEQQPVRILQQRPDQEPWGAFVLLGSGANSSRIRHCEMVGGSGLKGDLFEYSGMFSVHDVKDVLVSDSTFRDNHTVDDMVHVVYSTIKFERVSFLKSFSDALDLDISSAEIVDSKIEGSGNDAIDLMSTQALVVDSTLISNGDKGVSVGEGSQLLGINNLISKNAIGIQSKDRSIALLFNQTLKENKKGLDAYKKNWRYGSGGQILISKSLLTKNVENVSADKKSSIEIFDTFVEGFTQEKRVITHSIDTNAPVRTQVRSKKIFSPTKTSRIDIDSTLNLFDPNVLKRVNFSQRGVDFVE